VNNQLITCIKVLNRRFPYEGAVVSFVFHNLEYVCHFAHYRFLIEAVVRKTANKKRVPTSKEEGTP
jgi:hypothetical protein